MLSVLPNSSEKYAFAMKSRSQTNSKAFAAHTLVTTDDLRSTGLHTQYIKPSVNQSIKSRLLKNGSKSGLKQ